MFRTICRVEEPLADGARVYIRRLDVFGSIVAADKGPDTWWSYAIQCEGPLPDHIVIEPAKALRLQV